MLGDWMFRLRSLFKRSAVERELDQELRFHVERQVDRYVNAGIERDDAVRRAKLEFGGLEQIKEECRDARGTRVIEDVWRDLRYAVRILRNTPGFAALAIVTLALGIGATAAVFSVVNAVLLHPFPYQDVDRLVVLSERGKDGSQPIAWPDFEDWRRRVTSFEAIAAQRPLAVTSLVVTVTGGAPAEQVPAIAMTASTFPILGVAPLTGRVFGESDDRPGADPVVVLGYPLWQRRFAGTPAAVGQPVSLDGHLYTIIGVMPPSFGFQGAELWTPLEPTLQDYERHSRVMRMGIFGVGRLRRDRSLADAGQELDTVARGLQQAFPDSNGDVWASVVALTEAHGARFRSSLLILLGAVGLVLLIACVNVAMLLLSRAAARSNELALRAALGADRQRFVGQALAEALPLAAFGAAAGVGLAWVATRVLPTVMPWDAIPTASRLRIDNTVLAFTIAIAIATPLLIGVFPALGVARADVVALLAATRSMTANRRTQQTRSLLVVVEVALALSLLVSAGLLLRTFERLRRVDPGFDPAHVLELHLTLPEGRYPTSVRDRAFFEEVVDRIQALPGAESVAAATGLPLTPGSSELPVITAQRTYTRTEDLESARYTLVTPAYFATMRVPLRAGRAFTTHDRRGAPSVAIVNEALARHFLPGKNPLAQRILLGLPDNLIHPGMLPAGLERFEWLTIVGVAGDARNDGISRLAFPEAYIPFAQGLDMRVLTASAAIVVRTSGDPARFADAARAEIQTVDPELPIHLLRTMEEAVGVTLEQPRFNALLLAVFAGLALVLAVIGIYGVVSHAVVQRTKEVGIRLALGASPQSIRRIVLGQSVRLAACGIAAGTLASLAGTRVLQGQLFGVTPADPLTFTAAALGVLLVAGLASWIPARRATKLDPIAALRAE